MLVAKGCQLRQVRHTEDLVHAREIPQLLPHRHTDTTTDALVDLVEDQGRHLVGSSEHILQPEHQAGCLTTGGDLGQRLKTFPGVGGDQKLNSIETILIECDSCAILHRRAIWIGPGLEVHAELGGLHPQVIELGFDAIAQLDSRRFAHFAQHGSLLGKFFQQPGFLHLQLLDALASR